MGGGFMFSGGFGGGAVDMSEFAKIHTDRLAGPLELNGKQYEKIFNLYLDEFDRRVNNLDSDSGSGMPGGFPGMMGGPGMMGPGMGGGFPGMGRSEDAEGGMIGNGLTQAQRTYMKIMSQEPTKKDIKAQQKMTKKMSKILSPEQFAKWKEIEKQPVQLMFLHNGPQGRPQGGRPQGQGGLQGQRGPQGQGGPQGQRGPGGPGGPGR